MTETYVPQALPFDAGCEIAAMPQLSDGQPEIARPARTLPFLDYGLGVLFGCAADGAFEGFDAIESMPSAAPPPSARFETPIAALNTATMGGIFGVTALRGSAKSGKSMFALLVALLAAARDEMPVVYVAAEMTRDQIIGRLVWLAHGWGITPDALAALVARGGLLRVLHSRGRFSWGEWQQKIEDSLHRERRALVVVDSINTLLADMTGDGDRDYWRLYRDVVRALVTPRKLSEGAFAALVVSEHNKRGASKGETLEYAADLVLDFKQTSTPRVCAITVVGTRERGDDGPVGEYRITPGAYYERVGGGR